MAVKTGGPRSPVPRRDYAPVTVALVFALTVLVLVPAHVYLVNKSSVLVFLDEVLAATSVLAIAAALGIAGLLLAMPRRVRLRLAVLVLGLSFLCWIHAYCLVWPYEVMDGEGIPWDRFPGRNLVDALLWLAVLVPAAALAPRLYPFIGRLGLGLVLVQSASLALAAHRAYRSPLDFFKHYYVERTPLFELSAQRNVIVILLDEFQSDVFAEAVLAHPEYRRLFPGFTYFPDTLAGFNFTEFALPAILTGQIYDNSRVRSEYLREAYLGYSLPARLKRSGFDVHLYPWRGFANEAIYYDEDVATNFKRRPRSLADKLVDVTRLVDLGLFRSAPQFAKRFVHADSRWLLSAHYTDWLARRNAFAPPVAGGSSPGPAEIGAGQPLDQVFLNRAKGMEDPDTRVTASLPRPVFKFYHLAGLHVPVKMKRDFTMGVFDYNRANFGEQAQAYARILGAFFDALRAAGCYDNAMIVVLGDHGSGRAPDLYVNPGGSARTAELDRTASRRNFQRDKARGLPLLLVKRFGAAGEIRTSPVPASVIDVPATVLHELGLDASMPPALPDHPEFHGESVFARAESPSRPRYYGAMVWSPDTSDFAHPITLYKVDGQAWSDDSWSYVSTLQPRR